MSLVKTIAYSWVCYKLADQGLANLLGLETLRHGTNPINYIGIRILGGMPSAGGNRVGATKSWHYDDVDRACYNKFYVLKDSEFTTIGLPNCIEKRTCPSMFKFFSGYNFIIGATFLPHAKEVESRFFKSVILLIGTIGGVISVAITPTIKFRVTPKEVKAKYTQDPSWECAYITTQWVAMWKIGLIGTLTQGLNFGVFRRIAHDPAKVVTGVVQIAAAIALAKRGVARFPAALSLAKPYMARIAAGLILFA